MVRVCVREKVFKSNGKIHTKFMMKGTWRQVVN